MTTEIQTTMTPVTPNSTHSTSKLSTKLASTLEERRGNAVKPLSLRPNRSFKKNLSLKPVGLKSR